MLAKRVNRIGLSTTLRISAAAKALKSEGVDVVDLSIGEPDFPTPTHVKDAAKRALDRNQTGYTANDGIPELKRAIIQKFKRDNGLDYGMDEVLVSPGAKFSLYLAVMVLLEKGEDVILPAPYWVSYPEQVRLVGANPVIVQTREEDGFRLTPERLKQVLTFNTKLLILNYPSNPAGVTYTRDELRALGDICRKEGIWILADEIYEKLTYDGHSHVSIASLSPELRMRTVLVNGLSKAYSMTGWRIGYAAGPREVISAMAKIQSHSTSNATSIAQYAGVAALEGPQGDLARMNAEMLRRRNTLLRRLNALDGVSCAEPHGAFYLFPNVRQLYERQFQGSLIRNSYGLSYYLLKHAHVAVVPGEPFGGEDNIRLSYATSMERLEEGMERIARAVETLERPRATKRLSLDNVETRVDRPEPVEVQAAGDTGLARLVEEADRSLPEHPYYEWNANIGGVVIGLRTNSAHLHDFFLENFYPGQLEGELSPHGLIYGVKGLAGRPPGAVYLPEGRTGVVYNTAFYGQLRSLALTLAGDLLETLHGVHVVRAAAVDLDGGRGLLLLGGPGSGMSGQLFSLCRQPGVRLVSSDLVLVRYLGHEAVADQPERKLYLKTKWVKHEPRLAGLFDGSKLENVLTGQHATSLCDGGDDCPVTRGLGACYAGSDTSRAMLDPFWLGGPSRHVRRTQVRAVALFRRDPTGAAVQPMAPAEVLSALENAQVRSSSGGLRTQPFYNEYLLDHSSRRMEAQRQQFRRLLAAVPAFSVNTAMGPTQAITALLLKALH